MALIIVLSAFNGLSELVKSLYNSFNSDIQITRNEGKIFRLEDSKIQDLKKLPGVKYYTEVLEESALLKYNDQHCIATLRGVSDHYAAMSRFDTLVHEGSFTLKDGGQYMAVLGKGISYQLNANINDRFSPITIYAPKRGIGTSINPGDVFYEKKVYLSGIFSITDDFDYKYIFVSIDFARELLEYPKEVSSIELGLDPGSNSETLKKQIKQITGNQFTVKDKYEQNELLFKTMKSEKLWVFIVLVFILIVATFNVIGSLTMLIIEKKKDIRILWDMGADLILIRKIFLIEGALITLIGLFGGLLLGTLVCLGQQRYAWIKFNESFVVSAYPIKMFPEDFLVVFAVVLCIGLLAAWYPVRLFTRRYFTTNQAI
jgi:lipoprotein-releasing system permease protein